MSDTNEKEWWLPILGGIDNFMGGIDYSCVKPYTEKIIAEAERRKVKEIREEIVRRKIDVMNGGCGIKGHTHHKPENWTWNRALKEVLSLPCLKDE